VNIAILGGSFDPIHNGHLALARSVVNTFDIDELHFVPAFEPPHKPSRDLTSPFHRFAMVALAIAADAEFQVSAIEADTLGPQYSVDTLERMRQALPNVPLLFIAGTDMYREIETWKEYRRLFELASIAIVHRPGFPMREDISPFTALEPEARAVLEATPAVYYLPWVQNDVSSTHVRETAARGEDTRQWVPPNVAAYISRHRLYQTN
jgi:nicotinate-nucleotide adenylyltransferase